MNNLIFSIFLLVFSLTVQAQQLPQHVIDRTNNAFAQCDTVIFIDYDFQGVLIRTNKDYYTVPLSDIDSHMQMNSFNNPWNAILSWNDIYSFGKYSSVQIIEHCHMYQQMLLSAPFNARQNILNKAERLLQRPDVDVIIISSSRYTIKVATNEIGGYSSLLDGFQFPNMESILKFIETSFGSDWILSSVCVE